MCAFLRSLTSQGPRPGPRREHRPRVLDRWRWGSSRTGVGPGPGGTRGGPSSQCGLQPVQQCLSIQRGPGEVMGKPWKYRRAQSQQVPVGGLHAHGAVVQEVPQVQLVPVPPRESLLQSQGRQGSGQPASTIPLLSGVQPEELLQWRVRAAPETRQPLQATRRIIGDQLSEEGVWIKRERGGPAGMAELGERGSEADHRGQALTTGTEQEDQGNDQGAGRQPDTSKREPGPLSCSPGSPHRRRIG